VDRVELPATLLQKLQCVGPVELERVAGLGQQVDPNHVEAGSVVSRAAPAGPAEQV
jgi:hypothetical protein